MPCKVLPVYRNKKGPFMNKANRIYGTYKTYRFHKTCAAGLAAMAIVLALPHPAWSDDKLSDRDLDRAISRGLDWLASQQSAAGPLDCAGGPLSDRHHRAFGHGVAVRRLDDHAGQVRGQYPPRRGLSRQPRQPQRPDRLPRRRPLHLRPRFLHALPFPGLGEEEDADRRKELIEVLTKAVKFTGQAQTAAGGWGYVSAKDGNDFDEGSTTITQVQGLRGCRNAGIPVPKEIIDKAVKYILKCTSPDGGVAYNSPPRPAAARHHRRRHRLPVQRRRYATR